VGKSRSVQQVNLTGARTIVERLLGYVPSYHQTGQSPTGDGDEVEYDVIFYGALDDRWGIRVHFCGPKRGAYRTVAFVVTTKIIKAKEQCSGRIPVANVERAKRWLASVRKKLLAGYKQRDLKTLRKLIEKYPDEARKVAISTRLRGGK
jgi:hypothetical protein